MKIELEFNNESEIDELYHQISCHNSKLHNERDKHIKMIKLLTGNESNQHAKWELGIQTSGKELLDSQIAILNNVLKQLEPFATLRYII